LRRLRNTREKRPTKLRRLFSIREQLSVERMSITAKKDKNIGSN